MIARRLHASVLAALAVVACAREPAAPSPPDRNATCGRLAALYAKENLPYESNECLKMVAALSPTDADCFDACTRRDTVKALVACQPSCRDGPAPAR